MALRLSIALAAILVIAGCGGGQLAPLGESEIQRGTRLVQNNATSLLWYANPNVDLPRHGQDGLKVIRPQGGAAVPRLNFSPILENRLEPTWRFNNNARARLRSAKLGLWQLTNQAYLQWTRHLNYNPGPLTVQVGDFRNLRCHGGIACYWSDINTVILSEDWIAKNYVNFLRSLARQDIADLNHARQELFWVLTHEAGHQFGYMHPQGTTEGCGGHDDRCHAPYGSGSVLSYDSLAGGISRYHVTQEDISHIPNATWRGNDFDRYTVMKSGNSSSIDNWGIWIDHRFAVNGETALGRLSGGNLSIVDEISATGWVHGKPSENVSLTTTATWSGEDNFLGVDLDPNHLGALLRADANLRYTFGNRPNLNLRVNNFEAHYARDGIASWHDHNFSDWGNFIYNIDCTSKGCSGSSVDAKWYPSDSGDPSGLVGGIVTDQDNKYTGSFVAEKD